MAGWHPGTGHSLAFRYFSLLYLKQVIELIVTCQWGALTFLLLIFCLILLCHVRVRIPLKKPVVAGEVFGFITID